MLMNIPSLLPLRLVICSILQNTHIRNNSKDYQAPQSWSWHLMLQWQNVYSCYVKQLSIFTLLVSAAGSEREKHYWCWVYAKQDSPACEGDTWGDPVSRGHWLPTHTPALRHWTQKTSRATQGGSHKECTVTTCILFTHLVKRHVLNIQISVMSS